MNNLKALKDILSLLQTCKKDYRLSLNINSGDISTIAGEMVISKLTESWRYDYDIEKLQFVNTEQLTMIVKNHLLPKSKYKIDQIVWYINNEQRPISIQIEDIDPSASQVYLDYDGNWWEESQLFESKKALIETQIKHWNSLIPETVKVRDESFLLSDFTACTHSSVKTHRAVNELPKIKQCNVCNEYL